MTKYFLFLVILLDCSFAVAQRRIYRPVTLADGWITDTVASVPLNPTILLEMMEEAANAEPYDLRGLVVVKDDKLVGVLSRSDIVSKIIRG